MKIHELSSELLGKIFEYLSPRAAKIALSSLLRTNRSLYLIITSKPPESLKHIYFEFSLGDRGMLAKTFDAYVKKPLFSAAAALFYSRPQQPHANIKQELVRCIDLAVKVDRFGVAISEICTFLGQFPHARSLRTAILVADLQNCASLKQNILEPLSLLRELRIDASLPVEALAMLAAVLRSERCCIATLDLEKSQFSSHVNTFGQVVDAILARKSVSSLSCPLNVLLAAEEVARLVSSPQCPLVHLKISLWHRTLKDALEQNTSIQSLEMDMLDYKKLLELVRALANRARKPEVVQLRRLVINQLIVQQDFCPSIEEIQETVILFLDRYSEQLEELTMPQLVDYQEGDVATHSILAFFMLLKNLLHLQISKCDVDTVAAILDIAPWLKSLRCDQFLDKQSEPAHVSLANALHEHTKLTALHLESSGTEPIAFRYIALAIKSMPALRSLAIVSCGLSPESLALLVIGLANREVKIRELTLAQKGPLPVELFRILLIELGLVRLELGKFDLDAAQLGVLLTALGSTLFVISTLKLPDSIFSGLNDAIQFDALEAALRKNSSLEKFEGMLDLLIQRAKSLGMTKQWEDGIRKIKNLCREKRIEAWKDKNLHRFSEIVVDASTRRPQ